MSFIGDIFGAFGARKIGRFNEGLLNKQSELTIKNAEIKKQVFRDVDKPRIIAQHNRDKSNMFVQFIKSGVDVDRIGDSPFLVMLDQATEQAFDLEIAEFNSTVAFQNEINNASLLRAKGEGERFKGDIAFATGLLKAGSGAYKNSQTGSILTGA
jgi:hypothetical protein|tara:strand:- start:358 stop:822 length:465 start_codon:yes stop_codon:yes gene_type:complete